MKSKITKLFPTNKPSFVNIFNLLFQIMYCKLHSYYIPTETERDNITNIIKYIEKVSKINFTKEPDLKYSTIFYGSEKIYFYPTLIFLNFMYFIVHSYKDLVLKYNNFSKSILDKNIIAYVKNSHLNNSIILIHGLGIGLTPYLNFIKKLNNKKIILFEIPNVSKNQTYYNLNYQEIGNILSKFILYHKNSSQDIILHSFGTTFLQQLLDNKLKFNKIILIDPVCFYQTAIHTAKYCCSTLSEKLRHIKELYKKVSLKTKLYHLIVHYFIFDIKTQYVCKRLSWGCDKWIREKKLDNLFVILGGKEYFYNPYELEYYLKTNYPTAQIILSQNNNHGDFVYSQKLQNLVLEYLENIK